MLFVAVSCQKTEVNYKPDTDRISVLKAPDLDEHEWLAYTLHDKTDFGMPTMRAEAMVKNFAGSGSTTYSSGNDIKVTSIRRLVPITYSDSDNAGIYLVEFTSEGKEGYSLCSSDMRYEQIFSFVPEGSISDTVYNKALAGIVDNIDCMIRDSIANYNALAEERYQSALKKIAAQKAEEEEAAEYKKRHTYFIIDEVTGAELDEHDGWHPYSNPNNIFDFRKCELSYSDYSDSKFYDNIVSLKVKWNQTPPYNNLMPLAEEGQYKYSNGRVAAGCVTIAVAQIMTYYRKGYNLSSNLWDAMTFSKYLVGCNDDGIDAATKMIKFVYDGVKSEPGPNGTSSNITKASHFLSDNGFNGSGAKDPDFNAIYNSTGVKRLVYASGRSVSASDSGHAFIIDGARKYYKTSRDYYDCESMQGGTYQKVSPYPKTTMYEYVSCNWGWGGSSDGWFYYYNFVRQGQNGYILNKVIHDLY